MLASQKLLDHPHASRLGGFAEPMNGVNTSFYEWRLYEIYY